jgi:hypothetical protein
VADTKQRPSDARVTASYSAVEPPARASSPRRPAVCHACTTGRGLHRCGLASLQARFWFGTTTKEGKR